MQMLAREATKSRNWGARLLESADAAVLRRGEIGNNGHNGLRRKMVSLERMPRGPMRPASAFLFRRRATRTKTYDYRDDNENPDCSYALVRPPRPLLSAFTTQFLAAASSLRRPFLRFALIFSFLFLLLFVVVVVVVVLVLVVLLLFSSTASASPFILLSSSLPLLSGLVAFQSPESGRTSSR